MSKLLSIVFVLQWSLSSYGISVKPVPPRPKAGATIPSAGTTGSVTYYDENAQPLDPPDEEIPPVGSSDEPPPVAPALTCQDETQVAQKSCEQNESNMASCDKIKALYNEYSKKKDDKDLQAEMMGLQNQVQVCSANLGKVVKSCDAQIVRCASVCLTTINQAYANLETDPGGPVREKNIEGACHSLKKVQEKNKFDLSQMSMMLPQLMQLAMMLKSNHDGSKQSDLKTTSTEPNKNTGAPSSILSSKNVSSGNSSGAKNPVNLPNFETPEGSPKEDFKTASAGGGLATGAGGGAGGGSGMGMAGSGPSSGGGSDSFNLEGNDKSTFDTNIVQGNPTDGSSGGRRGGAFMRGPGGGEMGASSMRYMGMGQARGLNGRSIASGQAGILVDVSPALGKTNFEKISMRYKRLSNTFLP